MVLQTLPKPSHLSRVQCDRLSRLISKRIDAAGGKLGFEAFMQLCLYAPELGYYVSGAAKMGESGDFMTAPEISPIFSRCVARQVTELLADMEDAVILEVGAGRGTMARELLDYFMWCGIELHSYKILELSPAMRKIQWQQLHQHPYYPSVEWVDAIYEDSFSGVVLANEVLDSFPTNRVHIVGDDVMELCVSLGDGGFTWGSRPADSSLRELAISAFHALDMALPNNYTTEINRLVAPWLESVLAGLVRGAVLLFDYGYTRREYFHPQRCDGTLTCFYQHRRVDNPLDRVGLQDLTSHVEFSSIAEAARRVGADVYGFTTQANFLISTGIEESLTGFDPGSSGFVKRVNEIKTLTLPGEMGDIVKVMAVGRGLDKPLLGFQNSNMCESL